MIKNIPIWKLKTRDGELTCVSLYKIKGGLRKGVACGTNGQKEGKEDLKGIILQNMKVSMNEISDTMLKFIQRNMPDEFDKYKIPFEQAQEILSDDELFQVDDCFYQRKIGGHLHTKVLVGTPTKWINKK